MAGGVSLKWADSQIAVLTGFVQNSPAVAVSGITQADPPVVTANGHGLLDGDVIKLTNVGGMTELDEGIFIVQNKTANTFELADVKASGYGAYTSGALIATGAFSNYCQLTGYNRAGGSAPEIDTTTICSTAAEFELGLPDFGTTTLDYLFNLKDTVQAALQAADATKELIAVKVTLPKSNGIMVQMGRVQSTSETANNGGTWTGSTTIRNSGPRVDFAV